MLSIICVRPVILLRVLALISVQFIFDVKMILIHTLQRQLHCVGVFLCRCMYSHVLTVTPLGGNKLDMTHEFFDIDVGQTSSFMNRFVFPNVSFQCGLPPESYAFASDDISPSLAFMRCNQIIRFDITNAVFRCHDRISMSTFNCYMSTRVGEATNPGPSGKMCQQLTVTVCNPTAILSKVNEIAGMQSTLTLLSETSATKAVQTEFSQSIKACGYRIFYGPPVVAKRILVDGRESYRGEAIGTAIMTKLPSRKSFCDIPNDLKNSCRVNSAVVRIQNLEVMVVAVYGYPYNGPDSKRCNDILLARIYQFVTSCGLPFIIGGDFNMVPQSLPSWQAFRDIGTCEAFEYYQLKNLCELPPTCRGSTRNDTCLIHPLLARHITDMDVLSKFSINDHTPLRVHFDLSTNIPPPLFWQIPKSWHHFDLSPTIFADAYDKAFAKNKLEQHIHQNEMHSDDLLQNWSKSVEDAVDRTMKIQHYSDPNRFPDSHLPEEFKGRCKERILCPKKVVVPAKGDSLNRYNPPNEVLRTKSKQRVKQTRRLKSLIVAIKRAHEHVPYGPISLQQTSQLQNEWNSILYAAGYPGKWIKWIAQFDFIPFVPLTIPDLDLLNDMAQVTEHDANIYCYNEHKNRQYLFHRKIETSIQDDSGKFVYKIVKDEPVKSLHEIPYWVQGNARLCRAQKGHVLIKPDDIKIFQVPAPAVFGNASIVLENVIDDKIQIRVLEGILPLHGEIKQKRFAVTQDEISKQFQNFWTPFWLREEPTEQFDLEPWSNFISEIEESNFPKLNLSVTLDDPVIWQQAIADLKNGKAFGVCAWRNEELKLLPNRAVKHLVRIFQKIFQQGFSKNMMQARTVLLEKIPNPQGMQHTRPITILGVLVRLASKVVADQLLKQLQQLLPIEISGGIPSRGSKDITLQQQFLIELAIRDKRSLGGYTLDLVKAFNLIPRWPLKYLFDKIGIPEIVTKFWFQNLSLLTRLPQIGSSLGTPLASTTGIPEGDSMSVLGMAVLSTAFYYKIAKPSIQPFTYADNWSWQAKSTRDHFKTVMDTLNFVESLRMKIDQGKSWAWGTDKNFKTCAQNLNALFPAENDPIIICSSAKDLGMQIHYDKRKSLGCIKNRVQEGLKRVEKLSWLPIDINQKAKIIQTSVWPTALYSNDSHFMGSQIFAKLRRAACKALSGNHHFSSAFVACTALCPGLQDPLLFVLSNALRNLRRLHVYNPQMAIDFCAAVADFTHKHAYGPASSLKLYLDQVEWKLDERGNITGPGGLNIDIFDSSSKEIISSITRAWEFFVFKNIQHRKGIQQHINFDVTQKVFQSLTIKERSIVALNVVGGFQSEATKMIWDDECQGLCPICGELDDRPHRLLHCSAWRDIRAKHHDAVELLGGCRSDWIYLPLAKRHDDVDILQTIFNARIVPEPVVLEKTKISEDQVHFRLFTDGACVMPTDRTCRRASWAVIQDITCDHHQRSIQGRSVRHLNDNTCVPNLRCTAVNLLHLQQTAARAELMAVVYALKCVCLTDAGATADLTTDSQYVVQTINNFIHPPKNCHDHQIANFDLVRILRSIWKSDRHQIKKIKAHRDVADATSEDDLWGMVANHMADRAASKSLDTELEEVQTMANQIYKFNLQEFQMLRKVLLYIAEVNEARVQFLKNPTNNNTPERNGDTNNDDLDIHEIAFRELSQWNPLGCECINAGLLDTYIAHACGAGPNAAMQVWKWVSLLKWPSTESQPQGDDRGISWFELVVNFAICSQKYLPIQIHISEDGRYVTYAPYESDSARIQPASRKTANSQAYALEKLIRQLENLGQVNIIPKYPKYKYRPCSSLYALGFGKKVAGISRRPILPYSKETLQAVKSFVDEHRRENSLYHSFQIPHVQPLFHLEEVEELDAKSRYFRAAHIRRMNKKKRQMDGDN